MANNDKLYGVKNFGTLEPEYHSDQFSPITVKGKKYALVSGLRAKLSENQSSLNELKKYQKSLKKMGRDLDEKDQKIMKRLEEIVANLNHMIDEQVEMFNLKIDQHTK